MCPSSFWTTLRACRGEEMWGEGGGEGGGGAGQSWRHEEMEGGCSCGSAGAFPYTDFHVQQPAAACRHLQASNFQGATRLSLHTRLKFFAPCLVLRHTSKPGLPALTLPLPFPLPPLPPTCRSPRYTPLSSDPLTMYLPLVTEKVEKMQYLLFLWPVYVFRHLPEA